MQKHSSLSLKEFSLTSYKVIVARFGVIAAVIFLIAFFVLSKMALYQEEQRSFEWFKTHEPILSELAAVDNQVGLSERIKSHESSAIFSIKRELKYFPSDDGSNELNGLRLKVKNGIFYTELSAPLRFSAKNLGVINLTSAVSPLGLLAYVVASLALSLIVYVLFIRMLRGFVWSISKTILKPLEEIKDNIEKSKLDGYSSELPNLDIKIVELNKVYESFRDLIQKNKDYSELEISLAKDAAQVELAKQVSHDIRSPLLALRLAINSSKIEPPSHLDLITKASERISGIASSLLKKTNFEGDLYTFILPAIEGVISEKNAEWNNRLVIDAADLNNCWRFCVQAQQIEFQSIVSNILNNAIESYGANTEKRIKISCSAGSDYFELSIADQGMGIAPENLSRVFEKGFSEGKENLIGAGSGLGLYHAKVKLELWGGSIRIKSQPGSGTEVFLRFRVSPLSKYLVSEINLDEKSKVAIVDDYEGIVDVWKKLGLQNIHYFSTLGDFSKNIYLMDVAFVDENFSNDGRSGISWILDNKDKIKSIYLVSNDTNNFKLMQAIVHNEIKFIPKFYLEYMKVNLK